MAAALGWRAGAVVAERIGDALDLLGRAEGEVAVVLREARPLEPHAAARSGRAAAERGGRRPRSGRRAG